MPKRLHSNTLYRQGVVMESSAKTSLPHITQIARIDQHKEIFCRLVRCVSGTTQLESESVCVEGWRKQIVAKRGTRDEFGRTEIGRELERAISLYTYIYIERERERERVRRCKTLASEELKFQAANIAAMTSTSTNARKSTPHLRKSALSIRVLTILPTDCTHTYCLTTA